MSKKSIREIIAEIRKEETFGSYEEYRQKHPKRQERPLNEQQRNPEPKSTLLKPRVINKYDRDF